MSRLIDRLPPALRDRARDNLRSLRDLVPSAARLPRVSVDLHVWLPCWALRLVAAAISVATASLVIGGRFGWFLVGVNALLIFLLPGADWAATLVGLLGFALVLSRAQPSSERVFLLLFGLHLVCELCLVLGRTSWSARIQLGVLLPPLRRFLGIQAIAQATALLGALLAGRQITLPWVPVVAGVALVVLAYGWLPRLGPRSDEAVPGPTTRRGGG